MFTDPNKDTTEQAKSDAAKAAEATQAEHDEEVVDEQGKESFPASDPPANY